MTHYDAGGTYDQLSMDIAKPAEPVWYNRTERRTHTPVINVHLLICKVGVEMSL